MSRTIEAICVGCNRPFTGRRDVSPNGRYFCCKKCEGAYKKAHPAEFRVRRSESWIPARIRIMMDIPVYPELRPMVGAEYPAEKYMYRSGPAGYVIRVNNKRICVRANECKEL